jgi:glycosyltransferase involved in cell wall biosynthesis
MTDPLGQSQIIPYLQGLSRYGYTFTILSFEKKERYEKLKDHIKGLLDPYGISWHPLSFTRKPPVVAKAYDVFRMKRTAAALHRRHKFDLIHCRGYLSADVGLQLKRRTGVKFFFDMRGFWADEKKDGGAWNMNNPLYKRVYRYYKKKEESYLKQADYIISLTNAGKHEMEKWPYYDPAVPLSVIPCCADMRHFAQVTPDQKQAGRKELGIAADRLVVSYLGSVGAWYMLDEMLDMFRYIKKEYPHAIFLFITPSDKDYIFLKAKEHGIAAEDIVIKEASRKQVPLYVAASDVNISFIKPVYSKLSSSPTKLGEVLSMGIPVISNAGVGDVEEVINYTKGGIAIKEFTPAAYEEVVKQLPAILHIDPSLVRSKAADIYDLEKGVEQYLQAYKKIIG